MASDEQKERLVAALESLGGRASEESLCASLGWDKRKYIAARDALEREQMLSSGNGGTAKVVTLVGYEQPSFDPQEKLLRPRAVGADVPDEEKPSQSSPNGANLGIERTIFKMADKLRGVMDPSEYKHVFLGLIFLRYISARFERKHAQLLADKTYPQGAEDKDEYTGENIFWVPKRARWSFLQEKAREHSIGKIVDDAMEAIEKENPGIKGVLPKDYGRPALSSAKVGDLIDMITNEIHISGDEDHAKDILGRLYEYCISQFAAAEGRRGGDFYTPRSVVKVMVDMLEPYKGRIYDPCCGSGGMFVQSEKFVEEHEGRIDSVSIWGQEMNHTTWRLCRINLALRGIDADIQWNAEGSFHHDAFPDKQFNFILANPPFNVKDWGGERLRDDVRWKYGVPPASNANFAWLQHIIHHLSPTGTAGVVLAKGSMTSEHNNEAEIRKAMIEGDIVDCMITLPPQLFYSTPIAVCLWFLAKDKKNGKFCDRYGQVLFIDASKMGYMVDRKHKELDDEKDIKTITDTYHRWREGKDYQDKSSFCKSVTLDEMRLQNYLLTPALYVGMEEEEDDVSFQEKFTEFKNKINKQIIQGEKLSNNILKSLSRFTQ